jgi:DNA-binding transcriptional regulator of glucitol operon
VAGTVGIVLRTALRVRWLPRHVLALALIAALILLGRWQWDVSESARGGLQNLLYAFQWWAMALMVGYGWWRLLRDDTYGRPVVGTAKVADAGSWGEARPASGGTATSTPDPEPGQEPDPELDDYNDYLFRLNARSEGAK